MHLDPLSNVLNPGNTGSVCLFVCPCTRPVQLGVLRLKLCVAFINQPVNVLSLEKFEFVSWNGGRSSFSDLCDGQPFC